MNKAKSSNQVLFHKVYKVTSFNNKQAYRW